MYLTLDQILKSEPDRFGTLELVYSSEEDAKE